MVTRATVEQVIADGVFFGIAAPEPEPAPPPPRA
jgi:hypothetical protein